MNILFYSTFTNNEKWINSIKTKFNKDQVYTIEDNINLEKIEIAIIWNLPDNILSKLINLKIIFSLGAGVDHILSLPSYTNTPIIRVKDPNMGERMSYHVLSQILNYQLNINKFYQAQLKKNWLEEKHTLLNKQITVGVLGAGFLGTTIGKFLQKLNYQVIGFKNSPLANKKSFPIYTKNKKNNFIKESDILVCILPSTAATNNYINKSFLSKMKKNSLLINIGRGSSLNENDLLVHLNKNKNFYVSLDVFKKEPLPKKHNFWNHPNIIVTPHIAALTDIETCINLMHKHLLKYKKSNKIKSDVNIKKGY